MFRQHTFLESESISELCRELSTIGGVVHISGVMVAYVEKRGIALKYIHPGKPQQNADWMWIYILEKPKKHGDCLSHTQNEVRHGSLRSTFKSFPVKNGGLPIG